PSGGGGPPASSRRGTRPRSRARRGGGGGKGNFSPAPGGQGRGGGGRGGGGGGAEPPHTTHTLPRLWEGVGRLLARGGGFVVEVPQALDLIVNNEFDTIYHEHLSEFSVRSLVALFGTAALEVWGLEPLTIHGGSMRVYGQRAGASRPVAPAVGEWLEREIDA